MADIASTLSATSSQNPFATNSKAKDDMDNFIGTREDFLTILLAQLKHQDPLDPMKGTEFIDSITRLSSVEQAVNQNQHLENIEGLLSGKSDKFGNPVSYLDKEIEFNSDKINLKDGESVINYNLEEVYDRVVVNITDLSGRSVYSAIPSVKKNGENQFIWEGFDISGNRAQDGVYSVMVVGQKPGKTNFEPIATSTVGIVNGADFSGDDILLKVGGLTVGAEDVLSVGSVNNN